MGGGDKPGDSKCSASTGNDGAFDSGADARIARMTFT